MCASVMAKPHLAGRALLATHTTRSLLGGWLSSWIASGNFPPAQSLTLKISTGSHQRPKSTPQVVLQYPRKGGNQPACLPC